MLVYQKLIQKTLFFLRFLLVQTFYCRSRRSTPVPEPRGFAEESRNGGEFQEFQGSNVALPEPELDKRDSQEGVQQHQLTFKLQNLQQKQQQERPRKLGQNLQPSTENGEVTVTQTKPSVQHPTIRVHQPALDNEDAFENVTPPVELKHQLVKEQIQDSGHLPDDHVERQLLSHDRQVEEQEQRQAGVEQCEDEKGEREVKLEARRGTNFSQQRRQAEEAQMHQDVDEEDQGAQRHSRIIAPGTSPKLGGIEQDKKLQDEPSFPESSNKQGEQISMYQPGQQGMSRVSSQGQERPARVEEQEHQLEAEPQHFLPQRAEQHQLPLHEAEPQQPLSRRAEQQQILPHGAEQQKQQHRADQLEQQWKSEQQQFLRRGADQTQLLPHQTERQEQQRRTEREQPLPGCNRPVGTGLFHQESPGKRQRVVHVS